MLELILGTDWVANRDEILKLVAKDVSERRSGIVVMVPELVSHDMERRLCFTAGDSASRYAEILPFSRLANRISESVGHAALACMDNGGRLVVMAAAVRQLHSKLKAYASVETRPEFLTGMIDAVDEFKRCCITPQDLMYAASKSEGAFAQKLEELSLIMEAYDGFCLQGKRDPGDQMNWALQQLENNNYANERIFYIDGFPDFTRQHFAIIEHLIQNAPRITVSLNCDRAGSTEPAFEKAGQTASALIRAAQKYGVPYVVKVISSENAVLKDVCEAAFQGKIQKGSVAPQHLVLVNSDSVLGECQSAAARIMELVRNGARYRDFSVVCSDISTYADMLNLIFKRCGIPLYQSGKEDVLQKSVIQIVIFALEAALSGFDKNIVMQYLKSPLSPLDNDTVDRIENYVYMWGISGARWTSEWTFNPEGLSDSISENARAALTDLNLARKIAISPLINLREGFSGASVLDDQINSLRRFFVEIKLSERLEEMALKMDAAGDNRNAQIMNQLWEILLGALDQLQDSLGHTAWDSGVFSHLFKLLLSQYDVGTIPPVLDAVTVGSIASMRCHQVKHQIILGAKEGAFPAYSGSSGVLSDQEREALRAMGIGLTGGGLEGLQNAYAEIYGVLCAARESIMVTYSGSQPSYIYRRFMDMTGNESEVIQFVSPDLTDAVSELVRCGDKSGADALKILDLYIETAQKANYHIGKISRENVEKLYGKSLRLSASQIDRQAECRFSYFLNYGLRARERKEITVDPAEFGTYVHAVLEHTATEVMRLGGFRAVSLDETMAIAKQFSDAYATARFGQLDSKRLTYLFQRNMQELDFVVVELWKELNASLFEPKYFELGFGDNKQMASIDISGKTMQALLRGFVDRIDVWNEGDQSWVRVVDYKTGSKDFDYCDVFNGIGLQMLLYLFALEENGSEILGDNRASAGVQYFPARLPVVTSSGVVNSEEAEKLHADDLIRKGLVVVDRRVLSAMQPDGAPKRLNCKENKDGILQGDIATPQQLDMLKQYVFRVLTKLVDEIGSGVIDPNPYVRGINHGICSWCPYKTVCHYQFVENKRNYKVMTSKRFWEEIGKELDSNG